MPTEPSIVPTKTLPLSCHIVAAYAGGNKLNAEELPRLLESVHDALRSMVVGGHTNRGNQKPSVAINKSVTPDYIICLEDGQKLKMLKRYLRTHYDLTLEEYRRKWGLPLDYPSVAPNYSKRRSILAKDIGLGRKTTRTKKRAASKAKAKSTAKKPAKRA